MEKENWLVTVMEAAESACRDADSLAEFLQVMASHHTLTPDNVLLLHMQMPEATEVGGYRAWTEHYHRELSTNAKPLLILRPAVVKGTDVKLETGAEGDVISDKPVEYEVEQIVYRPVHLYDISQTVPDDDSTDVIAEYPLSEDEIISAFRALTDCEVLPGETGSKLVRYDAENNCLELLTDSKQLIAAGLVSALTEMEAKRVLPDTDKMYLGLVCECASEVVLTINHIEHKKNILLYDAWNSDDGKAPEQYLELHNQVYWTARRVQARLRTAVNKPMSLDFGETCLVNQLMTDTDWDAQVARLESIKNHTRIPVLVEEARSLAEKLETMDEDKLKKLYEDRCQHRVLTQPIYRI